MLVNNSGDSGCGVNAMEAVVGVQVEAVAVEDVATVAAYRVQWWESWWRWKEFRLYAVQVVGDGSAMSCGGGGDERSCRVDGAKRCGGGGARVSRWFSFALK
ncbi:unnamed protein product [Eruca vesicaria subsp. sativa]|uniref:Uncharacterized protein n=1 Tax=Eruca vesicaria subsp. sativa TaxID=29727 RepID=A0ABC8J964_ERUVS|nr:unnamed protein product [Eruca vesicaria subsp. sativa]